MKRILWIVLCVATLGGAAYLVLKKRKGGSVADEDYSPGEEPAPAIGFPVFPAILVSEVRGAAAITKNPGNLRVSGDNWLGKVGAYNGFEAFTDYAYGVRALLKTLVTYMNVHALRTIDEIINRYAPASENNTFTYVQNMMLWTGKQPSQQLTLSDIPNLATAIIRQEVGITSANQAVLFNYVKQVNSYFKII